MKRSVSSAAVLTAGLLSGCSMTGPGQLKVHEALLYGGTQERVVWVYGTLGGSSSSLRLGGQTVELRAQVSDPVAVPGTLSVNGKATYRLPTTAMGPKIAVTSSAAGTFDVRASDSSVAAVYYTDGARWTRLAGVNGRVGGQAVAGLDGAGNLNAAEATALSRALLGQGPLAVAVLAESNLPDAPLAVEPAAQEYLRTGLYILPNVVSLPVVPGAVVPSPGRPVPPKPAPAPVPTPPTPGARVNVTELASGTQASVQTFGVQLATTQAEASALYARAYGRQTGVPEAARVGSSTIVGVFLGQRATGGYGIRVLGASASGGVLTLTVQVRAPAPGAITTQALTSPWTLVRVDGAFTRVNVVDERGQPLPAGVPGGGDVR
ncbi:protease complex subunit PrcB family protein [Deinococcus koreensis]|uniref:PrcB C-terminal domain-containing protein n=1 Tax=Deinococcus koreensis TaxID=2054903 RepID=A0A2K3V1E8_9DEIO|nr:protease complex subunit PrcB family protein [Deinococcus koreensis]PNY82616.1 hypothetical protein CVO96_15780 [Deinococcus koreensis]